jgi:hypothetical protein
MSELNGRGNLERMARGIRAGWLTLQHTVKRRCLQKYSAEI